MWYEILPPMTIIFAALAFPSYATIPIMAFFQNRNPYKRKLLPYFNKDLYLRDLRLSGKPYVIQGLNNIPDDDIEAPPSRGTEEGGRGEEGKKEELPIKERQQEPKQEAIKPVVQPQEQLKPVVPPKEEIKLVVPPIEAPKSNIKPEDIFKIPEDSQKEVKK